VSRDRGIRLVRRRRGFAVAAHAAPTGAGVMTQAAKACSRLRAASMNDISKGRPGSNSGKR